MRTVTIVSQFRKAPRWMLHAVTKFSGTTFTHIGLDSRGTAQSPTAIALASR